MVQIKGEVVSSCSGGLYGPAQRNEAIRHLAFRKVLDIEGLGIESLGDKVAGSVSIKHLCSVR